TIHPNTAAVTVDDGYEEFFSLAVPVLRTYGVPASVFVISDFIDGRLWVWTDRLRFIFEHAPRHSLAFMYRGTSRIVDLRCDDDRRRLEEYWREHAKTLTASERQDLLENLAEAFGIEIP